MSRTIALLLVMLSACSLICVVWAQEPMTRPVALPPSVGLTSGEAEIEARLAAPVMLEIVDVDLATAMASIAEGQGIDIQIDERAIADSAIDVSVPVKSRNRRPLPLGQALDLMLDPLQLTYAVQHGVVRITSKEKADGILITRVYPVEDLVKMSAASNQPYMPNKSGLSFGPLIQMIEDTIAPDSWDTNSGVGSIKPFTSAPGGLALVISNTHKTHYQVATLLADLRALKQVSGGVGQAPVVAQ